MLAACGRPANPVVVYAAASLTAPFTAIGDAFAKTEPEYAVQCVFEGSPNLVLKLQQGGIAQHFGAVVHAGLAGGEMTDLWSVITADVGPLSHPNQ